MSDHDDAPREHDADLPPPDQIETGEPLHELRMLQVSSPAGFVARFRAAVGRRLLSAQLVELLGGALVAAVEILNFVVALAGPPGRQKGGR